MQGFDLFCASSGFSANSGFSEMIKRLKNLHPTYGYLLGQAKIFGSTCLTQDSNQNGQEHFW